MSPGGLPWRACWHLAAGVQSYEDHRRLRYVEVTSLAASCLREFWPVGTLSPVEMGGSISAPLFLFLWRKHPYSYHRPSLPSKFSIQSSRAFKRTYTIYQMYWGKVDFFVPVLFGFSVTLDTVHLPPRTVSAALIFPPTPCPFLSGCPSLPAGGPLSFTQSNFVFLKGWGLSQHMFSLFPPFP